MLLTGFLSGADNLSAGNPENEGRDKRPGKTGGEIARSERAINRALLSLSYEREFTDDELETYGLAYFKEKGVAPSISDIEKLSKPRKLNEDPCWLELFESDWERFVLYFSHVKWFARSAEQAANILDLIEIAPTSKMNLTEIEDATK